MTPDTTFIYALVDPRDNEVRYIGKSDNPDKRLSEHMHCTHNAHKRAWIQELSEVSLAPEVNVLAEVPFDEWDIQERFWIQQKISDGCNLLNIRSGGCNKGNYGGARGKLVIKNPDKLFSTLRKKTKQDSMKGISGELKVSRSAMASALSGNTVSARTVRAIANYLKCNVMMIAEFV